MPNVSVRRDTTQTTQTLRELAEYLATDLLAQGVAPDTIGQLLADVTSAGVRSAITAQVHGIGT